MKKLISLVIATCMILCCSSSALANEAEPERMNQGQLQAAASYFFWQVVNSDPSSEWSSKDNFQEPIPLYTENDELIAYYIKTIDEHRNINGYMVVSAFTDNPCVLEYGYGEPIANRINEFSSNKNQKVYYGLNGTFSNTIYDTEQNISSTNSQKSQNDTNVDLVTLLSEENNVLKEKINEIYDEDIKNNNTRSTYSDWGLINVSDMPTSSYSANNLIRLGNVSSWAKTSDAPNLDNHCGPTSGTNMLLYYGTKLGTNLIRIDKENTIEELYDYMGTISTGTGPYGYAQGIRDYLADYYPSRTITFNILTTTSWNTLKSNINSNTMTAAYMWSNTIIDGAHYVNYVGWRSYSDGSNYARVLTNWNTDANYYILFNTSHTLLVENVVKVVIT